jgi:hypothetical protein
MVSYTNDRGCMCDSGKESGCLYLGYHSVEAGSRIVRLRLEMAGDELALLHQLVPAKKKASKLLVDASDLDHHIVHALPHGQRVLKEVGGHPGDTFNLIDKRLNVR